jgi:polysaccharide export outer membrane protein
MLMITTPGFSRRGLFYIVLFGIILTASSCVDTKKAVYFSDINPGNLQTNVPMLDNKVMAEDLVSIIISSPNPEAASPFNVPGNNYLVSKDGFIDFPVLGSMKVLGYTREQLRSSILKTLTDKKLLAYPIVIVRFLSFKVTVLGDVAGPKVIPVPDEHITLLEAIAQAGDLLPSARKDNVLVIRDDNGQKIAQRLDLSSKEIFTSDYYYLKPNDIIYVEPNKNKIMTNQARSPQWIGLVLSGITFAITVATFLKF